MNVIIIVLHFDKWEKSHVCIFTPKRKKALITYYTNANTVKIKTGDIFFVNQLFYIPLGKYNYIIVSYTSRTNARYLSFNFPTVSEMAVSLFNASKYNMRIISTNLYQRFQIILCCRDCSTKEVLSKPSNLRFQIAQTWYNWKCPCWLCTG